MGTQIGANPLQALQRVPDDGSVLLQDYNEPLSLTLRQVIVDDNWHGSVVVNSIQEAVASTLGEKVAVAPLCQAYSGRPVLAPG